MENGQPNAKPSSVNSLYGIINYPYIKYIQRGEFTHEGVIWGIFSQFSETMVYFFNAVSYVVFVILEHLTMKFNWNNPDDHSHKGDCMSVNENFETWLLFGWQLCCQPIRSHVRKFLLTDMDFNIDFLCNGGPHLWNKCQLMGQHGKNVTQ